MIRKKIHYIWFGGKSLSNLAEKCIESWKKYCPDYEIIEWNENNFDFRNNSYALEAYRNKKWAFVSDYARLKILFEEGGIYMDTDVELLQSLNDFLDYKLFFGFEAVDRISTGIIGAEKNNADIKKLLESYDTRSFVNKDGTLDLTTNVEIITNYFVRKGLCLNNIKQNLDDVMFFPCEFFCPKDYETKKINITKNSYAIHHFDGSWIPQSTKIYQNIVRNLRDNLNGDVFNTLKSIKKIIKK